MADQAQHVLIIVKLARNTYEAWMKGFQAYTSSHTRERAVGTLAALHPEIFKFPNASHPRWPGYEEMGRRILKNPASFDITIDERGDPDLIR